MSADNTIGIIFGRRSGTSTMAKELYERGYPLREPVDTRHFGNQPQGHYESWEARDYDAKILHHFKMTTTVPGLAPFLKFEPLRDWFDAHPDPFLVKEPSVSFAWPVWLRTAAGRPLVGLWCRREADEQVASLVRAYSMDEEDARWCVEMQETATEAAKRYIQMEEVWLTDPGRVDKAAAWFEKHGIEQVRAHHLQEA